MDMAKKLLTVSSSPHIHTEENTRSIMFDVIIALMPALVMGIFFFGYRALSVTIIAVASCIAFEYLYQYFMKKDLRVNDLSAIVTGIILAFNLPVTIPYWMVVVGSGFAIILVKQLYGGIGKNFMNPAAAARVFLAAAWPTAMGVWLKPMAEKLPSVFDATVTDAITTATPLGIIKEGGTIDLLPSISDMAVGKIGGCIGEVSAIMLLLGGLYLVLRGIITIRIPFAFLSTVAVLTFLFPRNGMSGYNFMMYNLLGGGLMFGAIFMATDYATVPAKRGAQWIFGIGCGLIVVLIRYFGAYPEGVCYAIVIMNSLSWLIEKNINPRRFGTDSFIKKAHKKLNALTQRLAKGEGKINEK